MPQRAAISARRTNQGQCPETASLLRRVQDARTTAAPDPPIWRKPVPSRVVVPSVLIRAF